ncbi:FAD-dependent monooxygenase [Nocardia zapadnayensis]|uniref:FAD-dependent monooxygenase n=1 Tax=Nocardia rhamnosiphila TaxID=426716 RepID=UPI0022468D6E|nr:FAD-dependent monooxygenase [Nocardia zapadnayensis]MCX0272632.1 FAD-dependent monooxygenase [Nocardia zapadnayensis]
MSFSRSPVLIVGAGPTGLTLGIELLRRGVDVRLIDRLTTPVTTSRSFTVHTRTLELLEQAGIVDEFQDRGLRGEWMDYRFAGFPEKVRLDFTGLDSRYPYFRTISQRDTEEILRGHFTALGGTIDWHSELVSVTTDMNGDVTAIVRDTNSGETEPVHPDWLIGCDGVHSTVADYVGGQVGRAEYVGTAMRMMDVPLRQQSPGFPVEVGGVDYRITRDHMLLTTALPGGVWRVLISEPGDARNVDASAAAFQEVLDAHFGGAVRLGSPQWTTVFRTRRRLTSRYRHGRIFVCGDAGHERSPAGGQGMNTSMQDAFNLGWKLAAVVHGHARDSLLDSYEAERRPIAEQVISGTHELHSVLMDHGRPVAERLAIAREPGFIERAVARISGIAYRYENTRGTGSHSPRSPDGLAVGDRAPDAEITPRLRLHERLRHGGHTHLVIHRDPRNVANVSALLERVRRQFGARIEPVVITPPGYPGPGPAGALTADSGRIHDRYGSPEGDAVCLIRPDGYIGVYCPLLDQNSVFATLRDTLT